MSAADFLADLLVAALPKGMLRVIDRPLATQIIARRLERMAVTGVANIGLHSMAEEEGWTQCCGGTGEVKTCHCAGNCPCARSPCRECSREMFDTVRGRA